MTKAKEVKRSSKTHHKTTGAARSSTSGGNGQLQAWKGPGKPKAAGTNPWSGVHAVQAEPKQLVVDDQEQTSSKPAASTALQVLSDADTATLVAWELHALTLSNDASSSSAGSSSSLSEPQQNNRKGKHTRNAVASSASPPHSQSQPANSTPTVPRVAGLLAARSSRPSGGPWRGVPSLNTSPTLKATTPSDSPPFPFLEKAYPKGSSEKPPPKKTKTIPSGSHKGYSALNGKPSASKQSPATSGGKSDLRSLIKMDRYSLGNSHFNHNGLSALQTDWRRLPEVVIRVRFPPGSLQPAEIKRQLEGHGRVQLIEIFPSPDHDGATGRIAFRPPPTTAFWKHSPYRWMVHGRPIEFHMELSIRNNRQHIMSVMNRRDLPAVTVLKPQQLEFGYMHAQQTMMVMRTAPRKPDRPIIIELDLKKKQLKISFKVAILDPRTSFERPITSSPSLNVGEKNRVDSIRFDVPLSHLSSVKIGVGRTESQRTLTFTLQSPPAFYRETEGSEDYTRASRSQTMWSASRLWFRQTELVYDNTTHQDDPIGLEKPDAFIDLGRWLTYRITIDSLQGIEGHDFKTVLAALREYNVRLLDEYIETQEKPQKSIWYLLNNMDQAQHLDNWQLFNALSKNQKQLTYAIRYQVEVCISQNILNEHSITPDVLNRLANMEESTALDLLEFVADLKEPVYDAETIIGVQFPRRSSLKRSIPDYCGLMRKATVTPTTIYFSTPSVEITNRVIRKYREHTDRFLRVQFSDEKSRGPIFAGQDNSNNDIFSRIYQAMSKGIVVGGRTFEYLASGNSQFRENGAFFFAPIGELTCARIRKWMGDFREIKEVARHAARIGQCFSTTRAIQCNKIKLVEIKDVVRNNHCFTDGVGKISPWLATLIAQELKIPSQLPSVYQFRLGGCKGILTLSFDAHYSEVHIRESQYKFPAVDEGLEIIRTSQFAAAYLNRQIILVLDNLGVDSRIFIDKQQRLLQDLEIAEVDKQVALKALRKSIDINQMTLTMCGMILDGFMDSKEPFVTSLIRLWIAWTIKYLKEKAKILIEDGAFVFGCADDFGVLRGHVSNDIGPGDCYKFDADEIPEIFIQVPDPARDMEYAVVEGMCLLARNPSLHPGDLRVVRAVDKPELYHLRDVVVLPTTGIKDLAGMCSGGDLDGDDYLVMWDPELNPTIKNYRAMDYTPPPRIVHPTEVDTDAIIGFFIEYIRNNSLGSIANAHLAHADELGVRDPKCLALAALHSKAVDFAKTGVPAIMGEHLRVSKWPHFMEKTHLGPEKTRKSTGVLGKLYDRVERKAFVPAYTNSFDPRILNAMVPPPVAMREVKTIKQHYDLWMRRIMAQNSIMSEFEVWSTFALEHDSDLNDYKFAEDFGRLSKGLKDHWQKVIIDRAGGIQYEKLAPWVTAMYIVTRDEAHEKLMKLHSQLGLEEAQDIIGAPVKQNNPHDLPLISFPWLFHDLLGQIAMQSEGKPVSVRPARASTVTSTEGLPVIPPRISGQPQEVSYVDGPNQHKGDVLVCFDDRTPADSSGPTSGSISPIKKKGEYEAATSSATDTNYHDHLMDLTMEEIELESSTSLLEPSGPPRDQQETQDYQTAENPLGILGGIGDQLDFTEFARNVSNGISAENSLQSSTADLRDLDPHLAVVNVPREAFTDQQRHDPKQLQGSAMDQHRAGMQQSPENETFAAGALSAGTAANEESMSDAGSEEGEIVGLGPVPQISMLERLDRMLE